MSTVELIAIINDWASTEPRVTKAYLFGGCLKHGVTRQHKDIDVAVEVSPLPGDAEGMPIISWDLDEMKSRLQTLLPLSLDLTGRRGPDDPHTPDLNKYLDECSVVVYDAELIKN